MGRPDLGTVLAMAAVCAALVLGGGGTTNPVTEAILQPLLVALVAAPLLVSRWNEGLGRVPVAARWLALLVLVIPTAQLVPLPPAIWQALPGRANEIAALGLIGAQDSWMPWSVAPARTFNSLVAMVPPVLVMLHVTRLGASGRTWVCIATAALGLVSMILGILQISHAGGIGWSLYPYYNVGKIDGFQANHNAEADVLSIALMAFGVSITAWLQATRTRAVALLAGAAGLALTTLALFLTGSRTGIALAPLALALFGFIVWPSLRRHVRIRGKRARLAIGAGAATLVLLGVAALARLSAINRVLDRFTVLEDSRVDIWTDTLHAIGRTWPWGGGVGAFPVLFNASERLEAVRPTEAGRAHCDWLEWTLEGGLPGIVVLVAALAIVAIATWRAMRRDVIGDAPRIVRAQTLFAIGVMLQIALHAIDDFPMRTMSLATLLAVAVAFLLAPMSTASEAPRAPDLAPPVDTDDDRHPLPTG